MLSCIPFRGGDQKTSKQANNNIAENDNQKKSKNCKIRVFYLAYNVEVKMYMNL